MKEYLFTLVAAALLISLLDLLVPSEDGRSASRFLRSTVALFLICVLISPVFGLLDSLKSFLRGEAILPELDLPNADGYREELESALDNASTDYFKASLTRQLESEFGIATGEVRCEIDWEAAPSLAPRRIRIFLSGRAIWSDSAAVEDYVKGMLDCEVVTVIE